MSVKVTYIASNGATRSLDLKEGVSVMEAALDNGVPEIESDCGGVCTCAACHVYVDPEWLALLPPMTKAETGLLGLLETRRPNSRLSCQIKANAALDGLIVRTVDPAIDG
jgi:2Fe-2S ferredoxin